jgi:hypothetical protein
MTETEQAEAALRMALALPDVAAMIAKDARENLVAAFTARRELQAYLKRRLDTFINPLVYTFWSDRGPSIMTMSAALVE